MAVATRPRKSNKRSIVGSMGLAPYEPAPEPERESMAASTELRDFYLTRDGRLSRVSRLGGAASDDDALSIGSSIRGSTNKSPSLRSRDAQSLKGRSFSRSSLRSPPPIPEEGKAKSGGMLSRLPMLGGKERAPPGPPPDTRRRKYNKTFGKKDTTADADEFIGDDYDPRDEVDSIDDRAGRASVDREAVLPQVPQSKAIHSPLAAQSYNETEEEEEEESHEPLLSPASNGAALLPSGGAILTTHEETDEDAEAMPGMFTRPSFSADRTARVLNNKPSEAEQPPVTSKPNMASRDALIAGAGAAVAGTGVALARDTSAKKSRKPQPADVIDDQGPEHIVNSSSLVPGLTGGYLDENVPSLGLKEPSILGKTRKGSVRSRTTATESEEDVPRLAGRQKVAGRSALAQKPISTSYDQQVASRTAPSFSRGFRPKSRNAAAVATVPESDTDDSGLANRQALQSSQPLELYEDPNEPLPIRTRRSMDVRRPVDPRADTSGNSYNARRSLDVKRKPTSKSQDEFSKRAGIVGAGVAAAPLLADLEDEQPQRSASRMSNRSARARAESRQSQIAARQQAPVPAQNGRVAAPRNVYDEADGLDEGFDADRDSVVPTKERAPSVRSNRSQPRNKSRNGLLVAGAGGAAVLAGAEAMHLRNGDEKAPPYEDDASNVGYTEPDALSLDDRDTIDNRSARPAPSILASEKSAMKKKSKRSRETGTMGISSARKRADTVEALTPNQRHYLLKALVALQMQKEWSELEKLGALTLYGHPFSLDRPKLKRVKNKNLDLDGDLARGEFAAMADDPYGEMDDDEERKLEGLVEPLILRHMYHVHLESFPGLDKAPLKYWQKRIQPFFDEMAARNFSTSMERGETTTRHFFTLAFTRYLSGFFARGVGVRGEGELRGPGKGVPGADRWGKGKEWGKGTVKRGLARPSRPDETLMKRIDALFTGAEGQSWRQARKEAHRVRRDWRAFKEYNIERETGLEETMQFLDIGNLKNLPPYYRNAEEYVRHFAAYLLHSLFVSSPNADDLFGIVKGIHTLFPYWGAKQLLKVANAQTMIQGILSLLLARPAGAKSLVQRIFVAVIGGQADTIYKSYSQPIRKAIGDEELCAKLEDYVRRGNRIEGKAIRNRAMRSGQDVLLVILLDAQGVQLSETKKDEVLTMHDCFVNSPYVGSLDAAYPEKTPPAKEKRIPVLSPWTTSPVDEANAIKYARLRLFLREILKLRDRDQACQMAGGSLVPSIIKESLDTVFYGPIKRIAEYADLSGRLGDLQDFVDDMIQVRKAGHNTLPDWIALAARHENSLYFLFHECAPIIKPFTDWLQKGADYMALSTTDPANPANRSVKNVEVNLEDMLRDASLTREEVDLILDEIDELEEYTKWQKVRYELEMRKNFLLSTGAAIPPSGLSADSIPKSGNFRARVEDIDSMLKDLMDQEGVPFEDGMHRNDARGTEARAFPWAWFDAVDPLHQHVEGVEMEDIAYQPKEVSPPVPALLHTRKALGPFSTVLRECLPAWREATATTVPASATTTTIGTARFANSTSDQRSQLGTISERNERKSMSSYARESNNATPTPEPQKAPKSKLSMPRLRLPFGRK